MKSLIVALLLTCSLAVPAYAEEPPAEKVDLKGGSVLFVHPDGTSRMVDVHGKMMSMADGVEMETADGRTLIMLNKKVWVKYGPPGKESRILKTK